MLFCKISTLSFIISHFYTFLKNSQMNDSILLIVLLSCLAVTYRSALRYFLIAEHYIVVTLPA